MTAVVRSLAARRLHGREFVSKAPNGCVSDAGCAPSCCSQLAIRLHRADSTGDLPDRGGAGVFPVGQVICQDVLAVIAAAMAVATERPWSLLVMTTAAFRASTAPSMTHW